jgi:hypothetical protein
MNQGTRPRNRREFMTSLSEPYVKGYSDPTKVFSEPKKSGMPEINRSYQVASDTPQDKDFSIGIKDIDEAVMYYFEKVLKLFVVQNNNRIAIPIIYGSAENWKNFQKDGYFRDKEGKLMAPLLVFKRNTITQNRNLGFKLDGNLVHNLQLFEKRYSTRNFYSNFNLLANRSPEKEYVAVATPDYVTVEYECVVWTHYMEQMDKVVEALNFASRAYWGDPNRFLFHSSIETFTDSTQYEQGEDRAVKTNFNVTLNGYLIPDTINKKMANATKYYGVSKIVFGLEITNSGIEQFATTKKSTSKKLANVIAADSNNTVINQIISNVPTEAITYINTNKELSGIVSTPTTVTFASGWLVAPSGLPATSVDNFTFFCNGQLIEKTAIVSFTQSSGTSTLVINPELLSYELEYDDEIVGIGKFSA